MHISVIQCSFLAIVLALCLSTPAVLGQVRTSAGYSIVQDSVNFGGGFSTSSNFTQESTFGEFATGRSTSTNFALQAGYQQNNTVLLSLTGGGNVTMTPDLSGVTGGESDGSTAFVAATNNTAGYQLTIEASNAPAMQSGANTIPDYVPDGAPADMNFTTTSGEAHFAFSVSGTDIVDRFRTNGAVCGAGSSSSTACWDGLSTTAEVIASDTSANVPAGATTTISFKVGVGGSVTQAEGVYTATTTITLSAL